MQALKAKLRYTMLNPPVNKSRYIIRIMATTCMGSTSGFPNLDVFCSEDELVKFIPKFHEFLADEGKEYFEYDFDVDTKRYIEFSKEMDYHADGRFMQLYEILDIMYVDDAGTRYKVTGNF